MKQNAFYMHNGNVCAEFGVDQREIDILRNLYGAVFGTRIELINHVNRQTEKAKTEVKSRTLTDEEMRELLKEQDKFAREHMTEEDKAIVRETREERKSIEQIQLEFAREMMRVA